MTEDVRSELRSLRERAFGPRPDIHDDPAALERLHELEAALRRPPADPPPRAAPPAAPSESEGPRESAAAPAVAAVGAAPQRSTPEAPGGRQPAPSSPETDPDESAPQRRDTMAGNSARVPLPRSTRVAWALSVVAAIVATAGLVTLILAPPTFPAATLQIAPDDGWAADFFGPDIEDAVVFEEHHGLTPIVFSQSWRSDEAVDSRCLYIVARTDIGDDMVGGGCGAGAFAATATLSVTSASPEAVLEEYAAGSALRFVLDGSQVAVYTDER